jgi:CRISPR/Cas system-associated exonuclease Cas4 (RecB family)
VAARILLSHSSSARLDAAGRWLASLYREGEIREVLIVAPSRRAADDLARFACPDNGGIGGIHRTTLKQLAAELAGVKLAEQHRAVLSKLGVEALAARTIFGLYARGERLPYFDPVARTPGFARALARTLSELRSERVPSADLIRVPRSGADLARLAVAFERALDEGKVADVALIFALAEQTARSGAHRFERLPILLADVFARSIDEASLIAALAARSPEILATAHAQDGLGVARLESALSVRAERIDEGCAADNALSRARLLVFTQTDVPPSEPDASLELFSAPGEGRECTEIARRVLRAASDGLPFDRMAILLRDPDRYQPLVEEALGRARVPAFYTQGTVRPDPAGRALLALLACAAEDLTASRFAEYLSLGQVPLPDAEGAPPIREVPWVPPKDEIQLVFKSLEKSAEPPPPEPDVAAEPHPTEDSPVIAGALQTPAAWERLIVDASVIGSRDRWQKRLTGFERELQMQLARLGEDDPAEREHIQRTLSRLSHLERFALPLIDCLAKLPKAAIWREWLDRLTELTSLAVSTTHSIASVIAELRPMEEVGPVTLDEVREVLSERLTLLRSEPPERRYGKVFVGTTEEARARSFAIVFLPGLAEGLFPKKRLEDPLLLDDARRLLSPNLPLQAQRSADERNLLEVSIGAAEHKLVASYPRMDVAEGKARVPSFYGLDLIRAAEGRLPKLRALEKRAARGADARLGWPAPRSAEEAIDDAEFDLAILDEVLRDPTDLSIGRGHYFTRANPHLYRSLRARAERWRRPWRASDGFIASDDDGRALLAAHRLHTRAYAATDLQKLAACPYQFLLRAIHRLRPRETAVALEELDPRTWGNLFHQAQFELFGELRAAKLLPMIPDRVAEILERVDRVATRVAADYEEKLAPAIPRVWQREIDDLKRELGGWALHMIGYEKDWVPIHAELAFGSKRREIADPRSVREEATILGGMRLRGAIDVVEQNEQTAELRVTDYKTGRMPEDHPRFVGHGEVLQPMLYTLAAEALLDKTVSRGRLHYCTSRSSYQAIEIEAGEQARKSLADAMALIDHTIAQGFFPAAPRKGACEHCDFIRVCGPHEEQRAQQKDTDALVKLGELRSIP